jgi:cholesterol transport system auxiliary component
MMAAVRSLGVASIALLLTACLRFGPSDQAVYYGIKLDERAAAGLPVTWQLAIEEPVATDPMAGSRIVLVPDDRAYGVFKDARWTDRGPRLIQTLLVQAFEDSGRITGVGRSPASIRPDFALVSDLRAFQAEYSVDGASEVVVVLSARLLRYTTNQAVSARVFTARAPIEGKGVATAVASFEKALNELIPQVVDWTFEVGNADLASHDPHRSQESRCMPSGPTSASGSMGRPGDRRGGDFGTTSPAVTPGARVLLPIVVHGPDVPSCTPEWHRLKSGGEPSPRRSSW